MSLNDDNRPSDRSVDVACLWLVEESFWEKDLRILNV